MTTGPAVTAPGGGASRPEVGAHRRPPRRRTTVLLAVLALALLTGAGVAWWRARPAVNVGVATVDSLVSPGPVASAPAAPSPSAPAPSDPAVPVVSGKLPTGGDRQVAPVSVSIPSIHVTARVVPVGVSGGDFSVPDDVRTVGWYEYGPGLTATRGSVLLGGHVDNVSQGPGAFYLLRRLTTGDVFTVTGTDHRTRSFRVVAREEYPKASIRLDRYFSWTGGFRVTLMTCGGPFDARTRQYLDNVAVTAVPVS